MTFKLRSGCCRGLNIRLNDIMTECNVSCWCGWTCDCRSGNSSLEARYACMTLKSMTGNSLIGLTIYILLSPVFCITDFLIMQFQARCRLWHHFVVTTYMFQTSTSTFWDMLFFDQSYIRRATPIYYLLTNIKAEKGLKLTTCFGIWQSTALFTVGMNLRVEWSAHTWKASKYRCECPGDTIRTHFRSTRFLGQHQTALPFGTTSPQSSFNSLAGSLVCMPSYANLLLALAAYLTHRHESQSSLLTLISAVNE